MRLRIVPSVIANSSAHTEIGFVTPRNVKSRLDRMLQALTLASQKGKKP